MKGDGPTAPLRGGKAFICWGVLLFTLFGGTLQNQEDGSCTDAGDYCRTLRADECYHNEEFCCRTCNEFATDKPSCKYGDRASVCTDEYCLFSWNLELCCHTCRMNLTSTTTTTTTVTTRGTTTTAPLVDANDTTTMGTSAATTPCFDGLVNGVSCGKYIQINGLHLCYRYQDVCCLTCADIRQKNPAECPYGDKIPWCKKLSRDQCYANNATCCETCDTLRTNISGCQFGDSMPSYCSTLLREDCYEEDDLCCATCHQFRLPGAPRGCQYGDKIEMKKCDRFKWNGNCDKENIREKCCNTCSAEWDNSDGFE